MNDEENQTVNYRVVSLLGQVLKTGTVSNSNVNIGNLRSGIYLLELDIDGEKWIKKFVKKYKNNFLSIFISNF